MYLIICLIILWFMVNLAATFTMYCFWYYERRSQPQTANLPGATEVLNPLRVLVGIFHETLAFMLLEITYPWAFWHDRHRKPLADGEDAPVLLMHGYACNSACMLWLARQLRKEGYRVRAVSTFPPTSNVKKQVAQLKQHVRDLLDDAGTNRIHYVSHSMGGVQIRDVLSDPDFAGCVEKAVLVAPPSHGSRAAGVITPPVKGAAQQMTYCNEYVENLPDRLDKAEVTIICSQMDNLVLPVTSSLLPEADVKTVDYLGHCALLYSPRVAAMVKRGLRAG